MTRVLYPGSFDPVHNGHVEVIETAARLFDEVVVAILGNPDKAGGMFEFPERVAMMAETCAPHANVVVVHRDRLLVEVAHEFAVDMVLKGLRGAADFDIELQMAGMNRAVGGTTTLFLPASAPLAFISSRFIREIAGAGGDVSMLVPPAVNRRLVAKAGQNARSAP